VRQTITTVTQRLLTPQQLAAEVRRLTAVPAEWVARVRLDSEGRWYEQIRVSDSCELWLISWLPGQSTGFHDHGGANGAFGVVWGELDEHMVGQGATLSDGPTGPGSAGSVGSAIRAVSAGQVRSFGAHHVHDVRNSAADSVAVSVHAYSPPLSAMTRYDLTPGGLVPVRTEGADDW
jgi:predicted metal-dependent enzyme (double-stranded beta helix superfamily)